MNEKERRAFDRLLQDAINKAAKRHSPYADPHAEIARVLRDMHNAFMDVGFDNDEAFTLVVTILEAQMAMATRG